MNSITRKNQWTRRVFMKAAFGAGASAILSRRATALPDKDALEMARLLGDLKPLDTPSPLEGGVWYEAQRAGDGIEFAVAPGALTPALWITADTLLDGKLLTSFVLTLFEREGGAFSIRYGLLAQCSARIRVSLEAADFNAWRLEREGAWLKPMTGGRRIDLARVDRIRLTVARLAGDRARFCLTPLRVTAKEPKRLEELVLPEGPLLDELGQMGTADWKGKTRSVEELDRRLQSQLDEAPQASWPALFTRWGGWKHRRLSEGTGFFGRMRDGTRWWLTDPEGYAFWSAGVDCVRLDSSAMVRGLAKAVAWLPPREGKYAEAWDGRETVSYLAANFIRYFGAAQWRGAWERIVLSQCRRIGFNTVGNWSEWEIARAAQFPYVRPMSFYPRRGSRVYRDFPDVFAPSFPLDAADYAATLKETAGDPALIGYFMMNEPEWAFSSELPAEGMLFTTPECHSREALAAFLGEKYGDRAAFGAAWEVEAGFDAIAKGIWGHGINAAAKADLQDFSKVMAARYFTGLSEACRKVDPNHLNLGMRWTGVPPTWAVEGMRAFDVFSMNCYRERVPADEVAKIHGLLEMPVMIGEYHFGALDAGLPASGIGRVATQADRGRAYRIYLENAAADPHCVGVHWFTLYDQSALGRFDGENYNIGFLDVCNRTYAELAEAARAAHEALYAVAAGRQAAFSDAPEYLPKIFL